MHTIVRRLAAISPALFLAASACLPYTVGSTARTVPMNETTASTSHYFIPNAYKRAGDTIAVPLYGIDVEMRHGIDARSDLGLRVLPGGVAFDYKRRVDGDMSGSGTAVAFSAGGGIVNGGEHAMVQGTLIASGREDMAVAPFGGLRAIQVFPIASGAVYDRPTIGVFGGAQLGDRAFTIRPELGVFYDHSALGIRRGDVILVPAITIQRRRREEGFGLGKQRPGWTQRGVPDPTAPRGCGIGICAGTRGAVVPVAPWGLGGRVPR